MLEAELERAVVVTIAGTRWPELTLDAAAGAIHDGLELTRFDFSIREYEPADFLILCRSGEVRDKILNKKRVITSLFTLLFSPWSRFNNAQQMEVPLLADVEIRGIPSHAWEQRTADVLLEGSGLVESVDASTMNRYDMSCFRVTLRTHSVDAIPAVRWLAVPEPESGSRIQVSAARRRPRHSSPVVLWYRVRFWVTGVLRSGPPFSPPPPPMPPTPPSVDDGSSRSADGDAGAPPPNKRQRRRRGGRRNRAGRRSAAAQDAAAPPVVAAIAAPAAMPTPPVEVCVRPAGQAAPASASRRAGVPSGR
jgi:hypothetical protein